MFHNGGYALCDVAMQHAAISMGYGIMHDRVAASSDYANDSRRAVRSRGVTLDLGSAPWRGRGVNSGFGERAGNHHTRLPLKTPGPDFNFPAKYLGGN